MYTALQPCLDVTAILGKVLYAYMYDTAILRNGFYGFGITPLANLILFRDFRSATGNSQLETS